MKGAYYFAHDSNARNDEKIIALTYDLGYEGYGIFWAVIELLHDQNNYQYPLDKLKQLAFQLRCDITVLLKVVNDYNLFDRDDKFFWSESLLRRMREKEARQDKAKHAADTKWDKVKSKNNAPALQTHDDSIQNSDSDQKSSNAKNMQPHDDSIQNSDSDQKSSNAKNMQPHDFSNAKNMPFKRNIERKLKESINLEEEEEEVLREIFRKNDFEISKQDLNEFIALNSGAAANFENKSLESRAVLFAKNPKRNDRKSIEKTVNINYNGKKRIGFTEAAKDWSL